MDELRGWKEIGAYFGVSSRTAQRWEREYGMPVHRTGRTRGASVFAPRPELDHWRLSPDGVRASSENPETAAADAAPRARTGRVPKSFAAVAAIAALVLVAGAIVAFMARSQPRTTARHKTVQAYASPSSPAVFLLEVTTPGTSPVLFHVFDGAMATVALRDGAKLGLLPDRATGKARLTLLEITRKAFGDEGVTELKMLPFPQNSPIHIERDDVRLDVKWIDIVSANVLPVRGPGAPPPQCCIVCGDFTLCAAQVSGECGNCCGFVGCRQIK